MHVLNPEKASDYIDTVAGERQRSAVLAIHLTWLDHASPLSRAARIEPGTPLDLLILYQAAASTFQDWPPSAKQSLDGLPAGPVINRQQAFQRLLSVPDEGIRVLATL